MQLHSITNAAGAVRAKKRVGCGESSGHGKTSGRGSKGQMSRSGHKRKPTFEGGQMRLIRKIPKRGFNNPVKVYYAPVNLYDLEQFDAGSAVDGAALAAAGLIRDAAQPVKVLGTGELTKALKVTAARFSATAREKIAAVGGECLPAD